MPRISCPACGTQVDAEPGREVSCPSCGFTAPYGAAAAPQQPASRESPPEPGGPHQGEARDGFMERMQSTDETPARSPAPWAYLLGVIALVTFWAADLVVPFVLGTAAIALGIMGIKRNPGDKRSVPGIALGALAIVAAAIFLVV